MKYFEKHLKQPITSREHHDMMRDEMKIRIKAYNDYYRTIENLLPPEFNELYLHDEDISSMTINPTNGSIDIIYRFCIVHYIGVTEFNADFHTSHYTQKLDVTFCYDEIELLDNGMWQHRIIFHDDSTLEITFRKILIDLLDEDD